MQPPPLPRRDEGGRPTALQDGGEVHVGHQALPPELAKGGHALLRAEGQQALEVKGNSNIFFCFFKREIYVR